MCCDIYCIHQCVGVEVAQPSVTPSATMTTTGTTMSTTSSIVLITTTDMIATSSIIPTTTTTMSTTSVTTTSVFSSTPLATMSSTEVIETSSLSPTPSPLPTPPSIGPSNLILTAPDVGQITANWEIPGSGGNFDGFHIYISPLPPPESNITLPITVGSDVVLYTISGLANLVSYNITIATYNAGGDGPSITRSIVTLAGRMSNIHVHVHVETLITFNCLLPFYYHSNRVYNKGSTCIEGNNPHSCNGSR